MTRILGLTGGIATGKSTVTDMFLERGIPVIDTDRIARDLLQKGTETYRDVVEAFGTDILLSDGSIHRKKLGQIVFRNAKKREQLNQIVHPHVRHVVESEIAIYREQNKPLVVIDVPLLFETGFDALCDKTVCVYTTREKQVARLIERDQIDATYANIKIDAQMPLSEKCDKADFVIDNSTSILETKKAFNRVIEQLEVT
jgi:dephospho-CoA kinase